MKKLSWIDLRNIGGSRTRSPRSAACRRVRIRREGCGAGRRLPPSACKVAVVDRQPADTALLEQVQIILVKDGLPVDFAVPDGVELGVFIEVTGEATLARACELSTTTPWLLVEFLQDPSKIPLEILLAAADQASGELITVVADLEDAEVTLNVLQRGPKACCSRRRRSGRPRSSCRSAATRSRICSSRKSRSSSHAPRAGRTRVRRYLLALRGRGHPRRLVFDRHDPHQQRDAPAAVHADTPVPRERGRAPFVRRRAGQPHALSRRARIGRGDPRRQRAGQGAPRRGRAREGRDAAAAADRGEECRQSRDQHHRAGRLARARARAERQRAQHHGAKRGDRILGYTLDAQRHVGYPIREFLHEQ